MCSVHINLYADERLTWVDVGASPGGAEPVRIHVCYYFLNNRRVKRAKALEDSTSKIPVCFSRCPAWVTVRLCLPYHRALRLFVTTCMGTMQERLRERRDERTAREAVASEAVGAAHAEHAAAKAEEAAAQAA